MPQTPTIHSSLFISDRTVLPNQTLSPTCGIAEFIWLCLAIGFDAHGFQYENYHFRGIPWHTMVYHGIPYSILTFFRHQNFPWHQLKGTLSSWTRATKSGRICGILYIPATRLAISMAKKSKIVLIGIHSFKLGFSVLWVHCFSDLTMSYEYPYWAK